MVEEKNTEHRTQNTDIGDGPTVAIVDVPEIGNTAESLGIEIPEDRDAYTNVLLREVGEARREATELLDTLLRITAEFDNFRKRTDRDRIDNLQRAGQRVVISMLPVLDSFDAALTLQAETESETALLAGLKSTHAQLLDALSHDGFESIDSVGVSFDPGLHEAVSVIPGEGEQIVDQEVRKGYMMGGRVIRPALVIVGHA